MDQDGKWNPDKLTGWEVWLQREIRRGEPVPDRYVPGKVRCAAQPVVGGTAEARLRRRNLDVSGKR